MAINGVIFQQRGIDHEDDRRTLFTAFNGDVKGFKGAQQVKFADMKDRAFLGGHAHPYGELFYLLNGTGTFYLVDVIDLLDGECKLPMELPNPTERLIEQYQMVRHSMLFIPAYIAHKGELSADALLVGMTAQPYVSPEHNDLKINF
jgi:hypothetical protein